MFEKEIEVYELVRRMQDELAQKHHNSRPMMFF